jgi:hypothetical protein
MQSDEEVFSRRRFLEWSAAGAAAAGVAALLPAAKAQDTQAEGERKAPEHPLILRSRDRYETIGTRRIRRAGFATLWMGGTRC